MFDIGWGELLVIGIVALVVIGPKELPALLRTLGQGVTKIRRMASEFQGQFQDAMREAELAELKEQADKLSASVSSAANLDPLTKIGDEIRDAVEKPIKGQAADAKPGENAIGAGQMPPIAAVAPVVPPELEPKAAEPEKPAQTSVEEGRKV